MAYCRADTSAKIGFRPYLQTSPFDAAHLSGLGQGHNPFTPRAWQLHGDVGDGLGAYFFNRPFDPWELSADTAPGLHGYLGAAGDDVVAQAADELLSAGHITTAEHDAIREGSMSFQDVLGFDPTDQASWYDATNLLRQWNNELIAVEQQYADIGTRNPQVHGNAAFQQLGRDLITQRQQQASIATEFVRVYALLIGPAPSGLSGLGIAPLVGWAIGAAVAIAAVYFGYQAFERWHQSQNISQVIAQTAQTQAQTQQSNCAWIQAAITKAQASGDTVTAQTLSNTLKQCAAGPGGAPMSQLEAWVTGNLKWIGLGAGVLVVLPAVLGGRRR